ncbi:MAG: lipoyl synthase [Candidatus Omnitrophota bacterium]
MVDVSPEICSSQRYPFPSWFRQELPDMKRVRAMREIFRRVRLSTVCESARCPNLGKCWGRGVATFMILGDVCHRACRFCAVQTGHPLPPDPQEPGHVAFAVKELNLSYAVITSVSRDDLADFGAGQFVQTVKEIHGLVPDTKIEIFIPDFLCKTESLKMVAAAGPDVICHNVETVRRLSRKVRPQADYQRSLDVLRTLKDWRYRFYLKSGLMVGFGETKEDVRETMKDLLDCGCDILTIGQYLPPSRDERHLAVERFVSPGEFEDYKEMGEQLGFKHVMSGPLVRSSFLAEQGYAECSKKLGVLK